MYKFIVHEGSVVPFDGINLPNSITVNALYVYGQDWIVVEAMDEVDALNQADLFDAGQHPANTEMTLFAATFTGMLRNDEDEALAWAGWKIVKIMKIYNGENIDITLVTDLGDTVIPAKTTVEVEVPETAVLSLHDGSMYVQEEGQWYSKTEQCHTGADMEIYSENIILDHISFVVGTDWVKENDVEVYDELYGIMEDFVDDEVNACDEQDMESFEAGNWRVEYLFRDGEAIYTAGRDGQHLANQDGWSRDKISDIEPEKIALYKSML